MKTLTKLISITLLIMLTQSCSKDSACKNSETNIYYNIADSNKAKIPYTGKDTLVFVSDQSDTATLIGQGKKTYYITNTRDNSGNADCQWLENKNYENVEINFIGLTNKLEYHTIKFKVFTDVENNNKEAISIIYNNKPTYASLEPCNNELFYSSFFINNKTLVGIKIINLKSVPFDTTT